MKCKIGKKIIVIILLFNMVLSLPFYLPIYGQVYAFGFNISEFVGEMSRDLLNSFLTTTDTLITGEDQGTVLYHIYEGNEGEDIDYSDIEIEGKILESKGIFLWPIPGYTKVGNRYTYNNNKGHDGIDVFAPKGTMIYAAADGIVTESKFSRNSKR